jgi:hypothetical protein
MKFSVFSAHEEGYTGDDDIGYYDYNENNDWSTNAADRAFCTKALDSCWDRSR